MRDLKVYQSREDGFFTDMTEAYAAVTWNFKKAINFLKEKQLIEDYKQYLLDQGADLEDVLSFKIIENTPEEAKYGE